MARQRATIDHRAEPEWWPCSLKRRYDAIERDVLNVVKVACADAKLTDERARCCGGRLSGRAAQGDAALGDGTVKQPSGRWHRHQGGDFAATAGFAEHRHVAGIAAKVRDVVAHPFQRRDDVE